MGSERRLILRAIDEQGPVDITVVATKAELSLLTVCAIVSELNDEDRVERDDDELRPA